MSMIFDFCRFDTGDKELTYLQRILTKLLKEIDMIGAPFSHFPPLRFIAPEMSGYKSFLQTHQELWAFLKVSEYCIIIMYQYIIRLFYEQVSR